MLLTTLRPCRHLALLVLAMTGALAASVSQSSATPPQRQHLVKPTGHDAVAPATAKPTGGGPGSAYPSQPRLTPPPSTGVAPADFNPIHGGGGRDKIEPGD